MSTTASTSTSSPAGPSPAPWKSSFLTHVLSDMDSPEFVLSTLHSAPEGSPTPYVPHARFCIFRGMWSELPPNKHNTAPSNPPVYESDMPTFTTDVRMQKVPEMFGSGPGHAKKLSQAQGSGGGGVVEAVWWVKEKQIQWRMRGQAFVVGPDIEAGEGEGESSGVRTVRSEVGKRMKVKEGMEGKEGEWSWDREVTAQFGNLSPGMRGSFKQPPPGQPKSAPYNDAEEKMGEKVEGLDDPVARKNFRVVVIRPEYVEMLDLSPGKAKREMYTLEDGEGGEWKVVETWP